MIKKALHIISLLIVFIVLTGTDVTVVHAQKDHAASYFSAPVAFWVWTPETNKWTNPKYAVKDAPQEQLQVGMDLYNQKEYKSAIKEFEKLIKHCPLARQAPDAQYHIGLCFEDQGELFKAFKEYQVVVDKYPFSELSGTIVQKQYDIGLKMLEGEGNRNKFITAVSGGDYDMIEVFRAVIKNAPYGALAAPAQYKIGLYLQEKEMFQESRDEFEKVINDYPDSEWAKAAKYQIAVSDAKRSTDAQYDQKITQVAIEEFNEFVENYPGAELSGSAKDQIHGLMEKEAENNFVIAQFYEKKKDYKAAKIYYQTVVDDFKNSSWAPKALKKIREMSTKE
jgi:outer membrane protein assembly factor BamD